MLDIQDTLQLYLYILVIVSIYLVRSLLYSLLRQHGQLTVNDTAWATMTVTRNW